MTDIIEGIDKLSENPLQRQLRKRTVRITFTINFHYGIHYIIEGENIFILRVFHTKIFFK